MQKLISSLVIYLIAAQFLFAQGKEGNSWVLGYPSSLSGGSPNTGGGIVRFLDLGIDTSHFDILRTMSSSASIADKDGNFLFYSNGCDILNRDHEIMSNGANINAVGTLYDMYCADNLYQYGNLQDMIILPMPKRNGLYKIIHLRYPSPGQAISQIRQSTVDMNLDGGLGEVVEKNADLLNDSKINGYLTATRHGNGVDWWITVPEWHKTRKYVFLLDSLGLHGPDIQEGAGILTGSGGTGQAAFSPDGTQYAEICFFQGQVLDFDRCTGKFSNPRVINYDTLGANSCAGVAFSPNGRFMYVARCDSLWQFDLSAADFNTSRKTIAQFDGIIDSTGLKGPGFYTLLSAPDDKIYINPGGSTAFHIIHQPNELGANCSFQKWGLNLPTFHSGQLPNLPNFRLGAANPPCIVDNHEPQTPDITIFPNPASDNIVLSNQNENLAQALSFQLYDALGRLWIAEHIDRLPYRIELQDLPQSEYFYRVFSDDGRQLNSGTLVKINR